MHNTASTPHKHIRKDDIDTCNMKITKITFTIMTSQDVLFRTAELVRDKTTNNIMMKIKQVIQAYHARGMQFNSRWWFQNTRNTLAEIGIRLNFKYRSDHIPEI